ncbi:MAG: sugar ABC transporter permease [Treponema sp.]|nr:sugar ABC transporter permease [Treponema sp.]
MKNKELKRKGISYSKYGYIFSIPFVLTFCICTLYPIIYTAFIGFTNLKGLGSTNFSLATPLFKNFSTILHNRSFQIAVKNTFLMWIINFIPQIVLALILAAWFTNEQNDIKGKGFFKVVFYMPNIITAATIAILFASLFAYPVSPVNYLLEKMGYPKFDFPQSKTAARLIVAFIQFWMWYGYTMIVLTSGILGISPEIFEAAEIDGANGVQKFFKITLPNLKTIMLYTLVTSLIGGLQMYDIPSLLMQNSGPDNATLTASVFIYNQAFKGSYMFNRAAAASMLMFIIIAILSAIIFYLLRDKDEAKFAKMERQRIREYNKQQKALKAEAKGGNK